MNTAIIKSAPAQQDYGFTIAQGKSMLDRIVTRLNRALCSYRIPQNHRGDYVSFIGQNLTDPNLGPEIHRTLR